MKVKTHKRQIHSLVASVARYGFINMKYVTRFQWRAGSLVCTLNTHAKDDSMNFYCNLMPHRTLTIIRSLQVAAARTHTHTCTTLAIDNRIWHQTIILFFRRILNSSSTADVFVHFHYSSAWMCDAILHSFFVVVVGIFVFAFDTNHKCQKCKTKNEIFATHTHADGVWMRARHLS